MHDLVITTKFPIQKSTDELTLLITSQAAKTILQNKHIERLNIFGT